MTWFRIALTTALLGGLVVFAVGAWARRSRPCWRIVTADALLWVWAWGVLAMTFGTRSGGGSKLNLALLDMTNQADVMDFVFNMLMFVPGGVLLAVRPTRWIVALLVGFGGSVSIELAQYALATGRTSDINDLIANTVGGVGAFLLATALIRWTRRRRYRQTPSAT